jgi:phosphoribosylformylglycinamidine synthase subunit PurL
MKFPDPEITPEVIASHGLTEAEFSRIVEILGRRPNYTELGVFSVMWSEHCSYKNTRPLLEGFPTKSPKVLVGAGEENAGVIDIGDGLAVAFKIESHNHPSAVEPFQGATTGVGGIIRDIFTMGARPLCVMNSLRFGSLENPETRRIFSGVVAGIAHYGNCFGIPTLAGEVDFDPSYEGNPLVNAFCLGALRHEQIARGAAKGIGNPVFYVGPATGRDGLAGAAFASQDLTDESAEMQRGAVQVGDPFMEKLCMEACLELLTTEAVAGIQDMGAAGLTCSTCETAARAGTGIEIELTRVPLRGANMSPYEILLSESQERMLIIVNEGHEDEVKRIFDKWDLPWAEIGKVTDTGSMVVKYEGETVVNIPARILADEAPVYHREAKKPAYIEKSDAFTLDQAPALTDPEAALMQLMSRPGLASKNWVYRQYDHMVRDGSAVCPGSDAAVLRIKTDSLPPVKLNEDGSPDLGPEVPEKFLAMTVDCNGGFVYLDPYNGGISAVAEAARNLACVGATPLGVTDNLNYGNPHNPELFYQLKESIRGIAEACTFFNAPVTGGNVSLYNQNPKGAIDPTPTIAMVGELDSIENIPKSAFQNEGEAILLLGDPVDGEDPLLGLGGSAYWKQSHQLKIGKPPKPHLEREKKLHDLLRASIGKGLVTTAHDCSEGGILFAVAECCISEDMDFLTGRVTGAQVDLTEIQGLAQGRLDATLFGETQARVVVAVPVEKLEEFQALSAQMGVGCHRIGTTQQTVSIENAKLAAAEGPQLVVQVEQGRFQWNVAKLRNKWWSCIANTMRQAG